MKRGSPLLAAALLILGTIGLLHVSEVRFTPEQTRALSQQVMEQQLGAEVQVQTRASAVPMEPEAAEKTPQPSPEPEESPEVSPSPSLSPSPEPVPVETVEEAWDEEARMKDRQEQQPDEVRVDGDVSLEMRNETSYAVDFTQLPALPAGLELDSQEPVVLIMHTHGSESYALSAKDQTGSVFRTQDETQSVIAVGDAIAGVLEQRGYGVVHDPTLCDYPEYTGAYNRSREVIQANLQQYPSIAVVLDIHRDAVENEDGTQMRMACSVDGQEMSQLMLVVGSDDNGLENPAWRENLALAAVLQARLGVACPGMMRPLNLRAERFNQDLAPLSLLVEVGASGNTLAEAKASAACFGGALADVMDDYSGKSS